MRGLEHGLAVVVGQERAGVPLRLTHGAHQLRHVRAQRLDGHVDLQVQTEHNINHIITSTENLVIVIICVSKLYIGIH